MDLFEKVRRNPPPFADEIILAPEMAKVEYLEFASSVYKCDCYSINVHDVVGTDHPTYVGRTWLKLFEEGNRSSTHSNDLSRIYECIHSLEKKTQYPINFLKVDGSTYIKGNGNHRTSIAKFLFYYENRMFMHGVDFTEIIRDHAAIMAYEQLKEELPSHVSVKPFRTCIKRREGAGWHRETWDVQLEIHDHRKRTIERISAKDASAFLRKRRGLRARLISFLID